MPLPMPVFLMPQAMPANLRGLEAVLDRLERGAHAHAAGQYLARSRWSGRRSRRCPSGIASGRSRPFRRVRRPRTPWRRSPGWRRSRASRRRGRCWCRRRSPPRPRGARSSRRSSGPGRAFEDLHAHRGVGARVAVDARAQRFQLPVLAAAELVLHARRGWRLECIRMDSSRVISSFTGLPNRCAANAAWLWASMSSLPPKPPPLGTSTTSIVFWRRPASPPTASGPRRPLALRVDDQPPVLGQGQGGLGLHVGVLDPLRLINRLVDEVALAQGLFGVALLGLGDAQARCPWGWSLGASGASAAGTSMTGVRTS